ncbi:uncharacterized protein LOC131935764 [Physella acuta]|uniref:uncharacterized protein LOC131935764 n=1 Tax=Physella acuta TaxID=109671 RepID=UPI0027DB20DF|nr:uncharacterized protein LOC131935764 [Physella acuta]
MNWLVVAQCVVYLAAASVHAQSSGITFDAVPQDGAVSLTCAVSGSGTLYSVSSLVIEKENSADVYQLLIKYNKGSPVEFSKLLTSRSVKIGTTGGSASTVQVTVGVADGKFRCVVAGQTKSGGSAKGEATVTVSSEQGPDGEGCACEDELSALENKYDQKIGQLEQSVTKTANIYVNGGDGSLGGLDGEQLLKSTVWPEGYFSLIQPETGCPSMGFSFLDWKNDGYRQFHTESSSSTNQDNITANANLKKPYQLKNGNNNFIVLNFCTIIVTHPGPKWPSGSYCILMYAGVCPAGFHDGNMLIDEENNQYSGRYGGHIPTAGFGGDSRLYFCCRRDGKPEAPVYLPTAKPFYLFRFGDVCQRVANMKVTPETIVLDTEDSGANIDQYSNEYHPDGKLNNVVLEMCYYYR